MHPFKYPAFLVNPEKHKILRRLWEITHESNVWILGLITFLVIVLVFLSAFVPKTHVYRPLITVRDSEGGTSAEGWDVDCYVHVEGKKLQPGDRVKFARGDTITGEFRVTEEGAHRHQVETEKLFYDTDWLDNDNNFSFDAEVVTHGALGEHAGKTYVWTAKITFTVPWYSYVLGIFGI